LLSACTAVWLDLRSAHTGGFVSDVVRPGRARDCALALRTVVMARGYWDIEGVSRRSIESLGGCGMMLMDTLSFISSSNYLFVNIFSEKSPQALPAFF